MNVYDFAKEVEGFIFGVKGIEGSDGIVYAKVVSCVGCHRGGGVGGALG